MALKTDFPGLPDIFSESSTKSTVYFTSVNPGCKTEKCVKERMRESESGMSGRTVTRGRIGRGVARAGFREGEREKTERRGEEG